MKAEDLVSRTGEELSPDDMAALKDVLGAVVSPVGPSPLRRKTKTLSAFNETAGGALVGSTEDKSAEPDPLEMLRLEVEDADRDAVAFRQRYGEDSPQTARARRTATELLTRYLAERRKVKGIKVKSTGTCKQGERSDLTGCVPASGEAGHPSSSSGESSWSGKTGFDMPPVNDDPAPGGKWYYHATPIAALDSVAKEGVNRTDETGLLSAAPHLDSVSWWGHAASGGEVSKMALLRFSRQGVRTYNEPEDDYDPENETAETRVRPIPAAKLEVFHEGQWKPLTSKPSAAKPTPNKPAERFKVTLSNLSSLSAHDNIVVNSVFGRKKVTDQEVAALVGAKGNVKLFFDIGLEGDDGEVVVDVSGPEYENNRTFFRDEDGSTAVYNNFFNVKKEHQGSGVGSDVFAAQVASCSAAGLSSIKTSAAGYGKNHPRYKTKGESTENGFYTWPRMGYDATFTDEQRENLPPEHAGSKTIQELFSTPAGRAWWKDNGWAMNMSFDLKEGSRSRKILAAYEEERRGRKG